MAVLDPYYARSMPRDRHAYFELSRDMLTAFAPSVAEAVCFYNNRRSASACLHTVGTSSAALPWSPDAHPEQSREHPGMERG